jgi:hypothetical protein
LAFNLSRTEPCEIHLEEDPGRAIRQLLKKNIH